MKSLFTFVLSILISFFFFNPSVNISATPLNTGDGSPDTLVVPNGYSNVPGNNTFLGPLSTTARTYQLLIHADQLTDFINKTLITIAFRLPSNANADWPPLNIEVLTYDIYLSGSVNPSERSLVFAQNIVGPQTQVRTARYDIPQGSYSSGASPNGFGPELSFDSPYLYTGGNLLIEIRHTGFTGTASRSNDAIGTATTGYGTQFSACWQTGNTATNGVQGNFSVVRITGDNLVGIIGQNEIPQEYQLQQNFPNPFNPSTTIQFSIPNSEFVTLKVFNSLGQEVSRLVNTNLTAGTYDFSFDATGLTSGIYFYELSAGDFRETKRMLLVK